MKEEPGHFPDETEDEEIKRLIQRGDFYLAADRLLRAYEKQIKDFCGTCLADRNWGEEVAQDVFFAAWQAMSKFRGDASVRTWLFAIARNRCRTAQKQRVRRRFLIWTWRKDVEASAHRSFDAPAEDDDPPDEKCVQYALRRLKVLERGLLHWRYVEGLTTREVAAQFRISETTVRRRSQEAHGDFRIHYERCMSRAALG